MAGPSQVGAAARGRARPRMAPLVIRCDAETSPRGHRGRGWRHRCPGEAKRQSRVSAASQRRGGRARSRTRTRSLRRSRPRGSWSESAVRASVAWARATEGPSLPDGRRPLDVLARVRGRRSRSDARRPPLMRARLSGVLGIGWRWATVTRIPQTEPRLRPGKGLILYLHEFVASAAMVGAWCRSPLDRATSELGRPCLLRRREGDCDREDREGAGLGAGGGRRC